MNKKFTLTNETIQHNGHTLHRIKALRDFSDVKKDDIGGWVETETNLSQYGDCWVYNDAKVYDNARVFNNAKMSGKAEVYDKAKICDNVWIWNHAKISGEAIVYENAVVGGYVEVTGFVEIGRGSRLSGAVRFDGDTTISKLLLTECQDTDYYEKQFT